MDILIRSTVCMLKEIKKKIIPKFYVLLKRVLKVNVMTVGVHKAGPYTINTKCTRSNTIRSLLTTTHHKHSNS